MFIVSFLSLIGFASFFGKITKTNSFRHIATAISFIVVSLYIIGMLNYSIFYTTIFLRFIGVGFFAYHIFTKPKVNILVYLPIFVLLLIIFPLITDFYLVSQDDFSHWAVIAKEIAVLHKLPSTATSVVVYNQYPPATALFGYFIMSNKASIFIEWQMIFAQLIISFSGLFFLLSLISENLKKQDRILYSFFITGLYLTYSITTILLLQVDQIVGMMTFLVISYFITAKNNLDAVLPVFLVCLFLSILKASSFATLFICLILILTARFSQKKYFVSTLQSMGLFLLIFIIAYLFRHFWSIRMINKEYWSYSSGNNSLILTTRFWTIYAKHLFGYFAGHSISIVSTLVLILNLYLLKILNIKDKKHFASVVIGYFALYPVYLFSLLYVYVTIFGWFGRIEAPHSMTRYMYTYLIGLFGVNMAVFFYSEISEKLANHSFYIKYKKIIFGFGILLYLVISISIIIKIFDRKNIAQTIAFRSEVKTMADKAKEYIAQNKKLFIIYENFYNKQCYIFTYEMIPNITIFEHCSLILYMPFPAVLKLTNEQITNILPICEEIKNTTFHIPKGDLSFQNRVEEIVYKKCNVKPSFTDNTL